MSKELPRQLGERIRFFRIKRGWTQEVLAERADCSVTFVGLIERGMSAPSLTMVENLARVLGVTLPELFQFKAEGGKRGKREAAISDVIQCLRGSSDGFALSVQEVVKALKRHYD